MAKVLRMVFFLLLLTEQMAWAEDWKVKSNQLAEDFTRSLAQLMPELGSSLGYSEFDKQGGCIVNNLEDRNLAFFRSWEARLQKDKLAIKDAELAIDVELLLSFVQRQIRGIELGLKYGEVPTAEVAKDVYKDLLALVNEQNAESRRQAAVDRLRAYVHGQGSCKPLIVAHQERIRRALKKDPKTPQLFPSKASIEKYLADSPTLLIGIKDLLVESGRKDWQDDFQKFQRQSSRYDHFLRKEILPKARSTSQLPLEIYEHELLEMGIDAKADTLIEKGLADYKLVYADFQKLAILIAKQRGLKADDPASVVAALKAEQMTQMEAVKSLYMEADRELSRIVQDHDLVSLPRRPLVIRLAEDAESTAAPVPHLTPPPLVNNKGERPEFVVPTSSKGKLPFDDFSFKAAALILTAHEGRPGHDLQFSSMLDQGVSIIRARYAFNSVNVEGWGLYAEDLVYPYLPLEAQFIALQSRLWRIARMFLDPQIQTGRIEAQRVVDLFTRELGVSKEMAQLEVNRYTFTSPGQAPSYYYGLLKLKDIRSKAENLQGKAFKLRCFNDSVVAVGLVPLELVVSRLVNATCSEPVKAGSVNP